MSMSKPVSQSSFLTVPPQVLQEALNHVISGNPGAGIALFSNSGLDHQLLASIVTVFNGFKSQNEQNQALPESSLSQKDLEIIPSNKNSPLPRFNANREQINQGIVEQVKETNQNIVAQIQQTNQVAVETIFIGDSNHFFSNNFPSQFEFGNKTYFDAQTCFNAQNSKPNAWNVTMLNVLRAKFGQNDTLKEELLATGTAKLVTTEDERLGGLLMQLREEYNPQKASNNLPVSNQQMNQAPIKIISIEHTSILHNSSMVGFSFSGKNYSSASSCFRAQNPTEEKWEETMLHVLRAKFGQGNVVRQQLLATGNAELVFATKDDARIGPLLMKVREEYKQQNITKK